MLLFFYYYNQCCNIKFCTYIISYMAENICRINSYFFNILRYVLLFLWAEIFLKWNHDIILFYNLLFHELPDLIKYFRINSLETKLLGQMVFILIILIDIIIFYKCLTIYVLSMIFGEFLFLHTLTNTLVYFQKFYFCQPEKLHLSVVFICISLNINKIKLFFNHV